MAESRGVPMTVDNKGRIQIPAFFRKALGLNPNDTVEVKLYDDYMTVKLCTKK